MIKQFFTLYDKNSKIIMASQPTEYYISEETLFYHLQVGGFLNKTFMGFHYDVIYPRLKNHKIILNLWSSDAEVFGNVVCGKINRALMYNQKRSDLPSKDLRLNPPSFDFNL